MSAAVTAGPLVAARDVVKHYGEFRALDRVSFTIQPGATVGLLGPNGAGKTTLMKTLLGFLPYTEGSIDLFGIPLASNPVAARQRMGFMPENDAWFPDLTGLQAVILAGRLSGMPKQEAFSRAYEVLDYLGLDESRHRDVSTYSVGMRQKVKLAQAVVHGPRLLLLDEPMSGLDPASRDEMARVLSDITRAGVALVLSSHVLHDVESLCSSVLMMDRGRILFDGPLDTLSSGDTGRLRVRVTGDIPAFAAALERAHARVTASGPLLEVVLPAGADTSLVFAAVREAGVELRELESARDSLEQAFLRLLGRDQRGAAADGGRHG
jgi:ABC-2 type transport system ATP-binding protein